MLTHKLDYKLVFKELQNRVVRPALNHTLRWQAWVFTWILCKLKDFREESSKDLVYKK